MLRTLPKDRRFQIRTYLRYFLFCSLCFGAFTIIIGIFLLSLAVSVFFNGPLQHLGYILRVFVARSFARIRSLSSKLAPSDLFFNP